MNSNQVILKEQTESSSRRPSLFSLPAELRWQIYTDIVPPTRHILRARYGGLRWLSASRELFNDAGPLYYCQSSFTACFSLASVAAQATIAREFEKHIHPTYGPDALNNWLLHDARRMIKQMEIICINNVLPAMLTAYFADVSAFPHLHSLQISFQKEMSDFLFAFDGSICDEKVGVAPGSQLGICISTLKKSLPEGCVVTVRFGKQKASYTIRPHVYPGSVMSDPTYHLVRAEAWVEGMMKLAEKPTSQPSS